MKKLVLTLIACSVLSGCSGSSLRALADFSTPMAFAPVVGPIFSVTGIVADIAATNALKEEAENPISQDLDPAEAEHVAFENMSTMKRQLQERRLAEEMTVNRQTQEAAP